MIWDINRCLKVFVYALVIDKAQAGLKLLDCSEWSGTFFCEKGGFHVVVRENELVCASAVERQEFELE